MSYYIRAFCTGLIFPDLATIQRWLRDRGSSAVIDQPDHAVEMARAGVWEAPILDLNTSDWQQIAVAYKRGKLPILAECSRDDGSDECLMREEIAEFIDRIGPPRESAEKRQVIEHLRATKFIIACQLPVSDFDDDGYQ